MMKQILAAIFFASSAFAGLPPTTIKGQKDANPVTTFNLQVPNSQATAVTGGRLIETGNKNVLVNPGFEAVTSVTGWVVGNATPALESLRTYGGKQALKLTTSSQTGEILRQTLSGATGTGSINPSFSLLQMTGSAYVWNQNFTGLQMCVGLWDGTSVFTDQQCQSIPATTGYVRVPLAFLTVSSLTTQSYGIRFKTTATETAAVYIDDVELKPAELGLSSPDTTWINAGPISITAVSGGTNPTKGTVTVDRFLWKRNGPNMDVRLEYAQGAAGAAGNGDYLFNIPASTGCAIDSTVTTFATGNTAQPTAAVTGSTTINDGTNAKNGVVVPYSATAVRIYTGTSSSNSYSTVNSTFFPLSVANTSYGANFSVACAGWTPQTAIATQNSNYDWRPYTPTFTGLGTVTIANLNDCREKREGPDNIISCKFTVGTSTATEVRMSLPYTIDAGKNPSIQYAGTATTSATGAAAYTVLRESGVQYFTFGQQYASGGGLTKANGSALYNSGTVVAIDARYPVAGWSENQNAPQLVGSVTSNSSGSERMERALVSNTSGSQVVRTSSGNWLSAGGCGSTGACTYTFTGFSAAPQCTCSTNFTSANGCNVFTITTTSLNVETTQNGTAANEDNVKILCQGPR